MEVNIHEAKTQLSRLIERALKGEEVTIAKAGHPLVRLIAIQSRKPTLGSARGTINRAISASPNSRNNPNTFR